MAHLTFLLLSLPLALASSLNSGFNHRAHAVPGGPYRVPDPGSGQASVYLDGRASHTHYFNPATGVIGRVIAYRWDKGGKTICASATCTAKFPTGSSTVSLFVRDSTGDVATASTTVEVFSAKRHKVRVVFDQYGGGKYSEIVPKIAYQSAGAFPPIVRNKGFAMRASGLISLPVNGMYQFRVVCMPGPCNLRVGSEQLLAGGKSVLTSAGKWYTGGTHRLELQYRRHGTIAPSLVLSWKPPNARSWTIVPPSNLFHVPHVLVPVINRIVPGKVKAGQRIYLKGTGFVQVQFVLVGNSKCVAVKQQNQFEMSCIVPGGIGERSVKVVTLGGWSNGYAVEVEESVNRVGYYQPVQFKQSIVKMPDGRAWHRQQITAITIGPDGRFFVGSLNGYVYALKLDRQHIVRGECMSEHLGERRSVLGVAFNPAQRGLVLYASVSSLVWKTKKLFQFRDGWHNGEIVQMQKTSTRCLAKTRTVVSGLPVSNYDHSVNGISFDSNGNLLVTVAGTTNAGVSRPNDPLGGIPDSPLSGAMLFVPVLKTGFNGRVTYTNYDDPATAYKKSGDVSVYAAGLRNSLCHVVHSNGHVYATDNGANAEFGQRSLGCNREVGMFKEQDALILVRRGGFHGYANRNRGRYDSKQCVHRQGNYIRPLVALEPSTNGLIEYTANTFGAQMRSNLLATKYAVTTPGQTSRITLDEHGKVSHMSTLAKFSGLTAAMGPTGSVLMPRFMQGQIGVLEPIETDPGIVVVTSAVPFRGPKAGGNRVTITGWNLYQPLQVMVGSKACGGVELGTGGRSLSCIVPAGSGKVPVVVKSRDKVSKSFGFEYWYMNV